MYPRKLGGIKEPLKEVVGYKTITVKGKKGKKVKKQVPQYKVTRLPSTAIGTETFIFGVDKRMNALLLLEKVWMNI